MRKYRLLYIPVAFVVFAALFAAAPGWAQEQLTAEEIVSEIHERFMGQDFKTVVYDEIRVVSQKSPATKDGATMPLNENNASAMKLRYFYQAPDSHGYKLLSEDVDNYWAGSPNQPGALPMDHTWKEKILNWYEVNRAEKLKEINARKCYVVTLSPKPGMPAAYPMTWYVDSERFLILKFIFLVGAGGKKVHTTGVMTYKEVRDGYWMPASAEWKTKVEKFPQTFTSSSTFKNYQFNVPLDPSVFEEEFPDGWFEKFGDGQQ